MTLLSVRVSSVFVTRRSEVASMPLIRCRVLVIALLLFITSATLLHAQDSSLDRAISTIEIPSSVVGGATLTGTVTLVGAAPISGQFVRLSSSSVAGVVTTLVLKATGVMIPFGQTTGSFQLATKGVPVATVVTITAVSGGVTRADRFLVKPPSVTSVAVANPTIAGGGSLSGTVRLDAAAPLASTELSSPGGLVVTLVREGTESIVPPSVTVPAGQNSATFQITTATVTAATTMKIGAAGPGQISPATTTLNVIPLVVNSLAFSPSTVTGGTPITGKVILNGKAPAGGRTVTLVGALGPVVVSGSKTGLPTLETTVTFPDSITVPAGQELFSFPISTMPVSGGVTVHFTADGTGPTAQIAVNAPLVTSISIQPLRVVGGAGATGTITLNGVAPAQGFNVASTSSNPAAATVPAVVTVAAGQRSATFPIATMPVDVSSSASIAAGQGGPQATLTIAPRSITAVTLNTPRVAGGTTVNGTVSINSPAPSAGFDVNVKIKPCAGTALSSSITLSDGSIRTVSGSLLPFIEHDGTSNTITLSEGPVARIPSPQTIGAFQLRTPKVDDTTCFTLFAFQGLRPEDDPDAKTTTLTVLSPLPERLTLGYPDAGNATSGFGRLSGEVVFAGSWAVNPTAVNVSCAPSTALATAPISVSVANETGATTARGTFETSTLPVGVDTVVTCSVSRGGTTRSATVTVLGPHVTAIELAGDRVVGGNSITGTITLDRRAPAGGLPIPLDGNNAAVATVSRVAVPGSLSIGAFQVTTTAVTAPTVVTLSAVLNGVTKTATFTVTPP